MWLRREMKSGDYEGKWWELDRDQEQSFWSIESLSSALPFR